MKSYPPYVQKNMAAMALPEFTTPLPPDANDTAALVRKAPVATGLKPPYVSSSSIWESSINFGAVESDNG